MSGLCFSRFVAIQLTRSLSCSEVDKFLLTYVILKLKLVNGKCIMFVNHVDRCYRLKLFLEQFSIKSCVLNSELPLNSRYVSFISQGLPALMHRIAFTLYNSLTKGCTTILLPRMRVAGRWVTNQTAKKRRQSQMVRGALLLICHSILTFD